MKRSLFAILVSILAIFVWPHEAHAVQRVGSDAGIKAKIDSLAAKIETLETETAKDEKIVNGSFLSPPGLSGRFYELGYYYGTENPAIDWATTDTTTIGTDNKSYSGHLCFIGNNSLTPRNDTLQVIGASITDKSLSFANPDTAYVVFAAGDSVNHFVETTELWLGKIKIKRISEAVNSRSTNVFFANYWDNRGVPFVITGIHWYGLGGADDNNPNFKLKHHKASNWEFNATGLIPRNFTDNICSLKSDHPDFNGIAEGEPFAYKRDDLSTYINADNWEGVIVEIVTTVEDAVETSSIRIPIEDQP